VFRIDQMRECERPSEEMLTKWAMWAMGQNIIGSKKNLLKIMSIR
jgi:hypothetical protein